MKNSILSCLFVSIVNLEFHVFLITSAAMQASSGLRLTNMSAPKIIDYNEDMELDCHFDMGKEELYAVKWYKDDHEFFRFVPRQPQNMLTFPVNGVFVDKSGTGCDQTHCHLQLSRLQRNESSGAYRCEVSSEAPAFRLASETHNVTVAALPTTNPSIEAADDKYFVGDILTAKCTSPPSDPPQHLIWYINKEQVPDKLLRDIRAITPTPHGLYSRSLQLRFTIEQKHAKGNAIELTCVSTFLGVPQSALSTSKNISLFDPGTQVINNQKFYWSSSSTKYRSNLQISLLLILAVVRWHVN